jgi:hypothetical protein
MKQKDHLMQAPLRSLFSFLSLLFVLGLAVGCNKSQRTDPQIASDAQSKIASDAAVPSKTIAVQAADGVVTLSGSVASENERIAASNDAAAIPGVKTVINNLNVDTSNRPSAALQTAPPPPSPAPQVADSAPAPRAVKSKPAPRDKRHRASSKGDSDNIYQDLASSEAPPAQPATQAAAQEPAPAQNTPPPPPAPPAKVTIPSGTTLSVRLLDGLDSERNQVGDTFRATLNSPIVIDDQVVLPRDADVQGRVVDVKSAGRFAGASNLTVELVSLSVNGKTYNISTNQWAKNGTGQGKKTAAKAGGGALLGAIIGGIAGGGKGAAIGTVAGGGAGAGAAAATNKANQIKLGPEALLSFSLQNSLTVTPQATSDRNAGRAQMNE